VQNTSSLAEGSQYDETEFDRSLREMENSYLQRFSDM
jgi:hypothetical protein